MKKWLIIAMLIAIAGIANAYYGPWVRLEPGGISCTHEIAAMGYEAACEIHPECCDNY